MDAGENTKKYVSRYKHAFYTRIMYIIYLYQIVRVWGSKGVWSIEYNILNKNEMLFHFYIEFMQVRQIKTTPESCL